MYDNLLFNHNYQIKYLTVTVTFFHESFGINLMHFILSHFLQLFVHFVIIFKIPQQLGYQGTIGEGEQLPILQKYS